MILFIHRVICGKLRGEGKGEGGQSDAIDSLGVWQSCQDSFATHEGSLQPEAIINRNRI